MLANGVTPMPAPTSTLTSKLNTSSEAEPKGPSTITRGKIFNVGVMTAEETVAFSDREEVISHPSAAANESVKSPTHPVRRLKR